jgi:hypothetical protein
MLQLGIADFEREIALEDAIKGKLDARHPARAQECA